MKCKKHYADPSNAVGVCASCLRERLFALIAAQEQAQAQAQAQAEEKHRNSDTNPAFPRSVSPYISRKKSDNSLTGWPQNHHRRDRVRYQHHHSLSDQRFYSTPQIGPIAGGCIGADDDLGGKKKQGFLRFSMFTNLFRSNPKNRKGEESDPRVSVSNSGESCVGNATSARASPAWFSSIVTGGSRRKKHHSYVDESSTTTAAAGVVRRQKCRDRGMSPARHSEDVGGDDEFLDGSSGYSSAESWKQTPRRTPAANPARRGGGHVRNVSGLAFCLSPLVRASPNRHWSQKGMPASDVGFSGEIRAPVKPHLANVKSFCANRSRKLADFGRFNPNR